MTRHLPEWSWCEDTQSWVDLREAWVEFESVCRSLGVDPDSSEWDEPEPEQEP